MTCKICLQELVNQPRTVDNWVCTNKHGGTGPKIGAAVVDCPLVDNKQKTTKAGFAAWNPLDPKTYNVELGSIPDKYLPLAVTTAENVPVRQGEITSVQFVLERACKMKVVVKVADKTEFLNDVAVDLTGGPAEDKRNGPTVGQSGVSFQKLHKGPHDAEITLTADQKKKYRIDGDARKSCDLVPGQPNEVVFTVTPYVWIKVLVRDPEQGAVQPAGKIKLKKLDGVSEEKDFPKTAGDQATIVPAEWEMKEVAGTCTIEELTVTGEELYEVISVTETQ
jgi:hypothetical protein